MRQHLYNGRCPDRLQPANRDPACPGCIDLGKFTARATELVEVTVERDRYRDALTEITNLWGSDKARKIAERALTSRASQGPAS